MWSYDNSSLITHMVGTVVRVAKRVGVERELTVKITGGESKAMLYKLVCIRIGNCGREGLRGLRWVAMERGGALR